MHAWGNPLTPAGVCGVCRWGAGQGVDETVVAGILKPARVFRANSVSDSADGDAPGRGATCATTR